MSTWYGVYLRESLRHKWDLNLTDRNLERAMRYAEQWAMQGTTWSIDHPPRRVWEWAIKVFTTDNNCNVGDQMGQRLVINALLSNQVNES